MDDLDFKFASVGLVAIAASSVHGIPSDDRPLFDVVDVLLPLYLALVAVSSGACDRVFGYRGARHRFHWELTIAEDIVFPTPLAGDRAVGLPDRVPASIPLGGAGASRRRSASTAGAFPPSVPAPQGRRVCPGRAPRALRLRG